MGDRDGQRKVLLKTFEVLEKAKKPGEVWHLPSTWPEEPKKTDWQPPEMSPLIKFYLEDIKKARRQQEEQASKIKS
jgi:cation diffusion facilitator CzcD-associated flavoprotein CzcO